MEGLHRIGLYQCLRALLREAFHLLPLPHLVFHDSLTEALHLLGLCQCLLRLLLPLQFLYHHLLLEIVLRIHLSRLQFHLAHALFRRRLRRMIPYHQFPLPRTVDGRVILNIR
jgi:hypothetical protein